MTAFLELSALAHRVNASRRNFRAFSAKQLVTEFNFRSGLGFFYEEFLYARR